MTHVLAQGFEAFTLLHLTIVAACAFCIAALVKLGLRAKRHRQERRFTLAIAVVGLAFWLLQQGYYILIDQDWTDSLPLHICDMAGLVGPLALLTRARLLRTTLYFWAFGLTIWGLVTPTLGHGPEHLRFWLFWLSHGAVIFYGVYDCAVGRYRPFFSDWAMACLVTMAYLAVLLPINLANEGWNYGYIGNVTTDARTPLDLLPAWPWRILGIQALGAVILLVIWLPWGLLRWRQRSGSAADRIAQ